MAKREISKEDPKATRLLITTFSWQAGGCCCLLLAVFYEGAGLPLRGAFAA
jgi:hypothetical protein